MYWNSFLSTFSNCANYLTFSNRIGMWSKFAEVYTPSWYTLCWNALLSAMCIVHFVWNGKLLVNAFYTSIKTSWKWERISWNQYNDFLSMPMTTGYCGNVCYSTWKRPFNSFFIHIFVELFCNIDIWIKRFRNDILKSKLWNRK